MCHLISPLHYIIFFYVGRIKSFFWSFQGGSKKKINDTGSDFFLTMSSDQLTNTPWEPGPIYGNSVLFGRWLTHPYCPSSLALVLSLYSPPSATQISQWCFCHTPIIFCSYGRVHLQFILFNTTHRIKCKCCKWMILIGFTNVMWKTFNMGAKLA